MYDFLPALELLPRSPVFVIFSLVIFSSLLQTPSLLWLPLWLTNLACLITALGFLLWWPVFVSSHHCNITLYTVFANEAKRALMAAVAQVGEQAGL